MVLGSPVTHAQTAHAVCGSEECPASSGARKRVKLGCDEDLDGGRNGGSIVLAGRRV